MRIRVSPLVAALAVVVFTCPVWAHSESTRLRLNHSATIGSTSLRPGKYTFSADKGMNQVMVKHDGKLVATIPGKEVTLKKKSPYTAVLFNGRQIHELQFGGKMQAIKVD
ncbi:MAG: hypothetical protein ACYDCD_12035 [Candidatus Acidiferrales bacterium]